MLWLRGAEPVHPGEEQLAVGAVIALVGRGRGAVPVLPPLGQEKAPALLRPGAGGPHPQAALFGGIFLAHERAQRSEKGAALPQADLRTGRVRASLEARTLSLSKKSFRQAAELFETLETFQKVV